MGLVGTVTGYKEWSAVLGSALRDFGLKIEVPTEGDMLDNLYLDVNLIPIILGESRHSLFNVFQSYFFHCRASDRFL